MWQPCFGKIIIMYKYVGVYIFLLMCNSSFLCYLGNIVEIKIKIKICAIFAIMFSQWNECKFSTHVFI
jgi:hypothetical protein